MSATVALGAYVPRAVPAMPRRGSGRQMWLKSLDEAIAGDALAAFAEMRGEGWSADSAHGALVGTLADYLAARIAAAVAMAADVAVIGEAGEL